LEELRKQQKLLEIKLQQQQNLVLQREKEQKIKELRDIQEARKARQMLTNAQVSTNAAQLQEMKEQILKLQQVHSLLRRFLHEVL
jgi:hypothetical protein